MRLLFGLLVAATVGACSSVGPTASPTPAVSAQIASATPSPLRSASSATPPMVGATVAGFTTAQFWPPGTRTSSEEVNAVLDAMDAGDGERLASMLEFSIGPCTRTGTDIAPVSCTGDEVEGQLVPWMAAPGCHGGMPPESARRAISNRAVRPAQLVAVVRDSRETLTPETLKREPQPREESVRIFFWRDGYSYPAVDNLTLKDSRITSIVFGCPQDPRPALSFWEPDAFILPPPP